MPRLVVSFLVIASPSISRGETAYTHICLLELRIENGAEAGQVCLSEPELPAFSLFPDRIGIYDRRETDSMLGSVSLVRVWTKF